MFRLVNIIFIFFLVISLLGCRNGKNNLTPQQQQIVDAFNASVETSLVDRNPDSVLFIAKQVIELAYSLGDEPLLIEAMNQTGIVYERMYMLDSANLMFTRSLKLAYESRDTNNISLILHLQANTLITANKYGLARQKLIEALLLNEAQGKKGNIASNYSSLGECYYYEQQYDSALIYFQKGLQYFEQTNNSRNVAIILNHISNVYGEQKLFELSKAYLKKAIHINDSINNLFELSSNINNMGIMLKNEGHYDSAIYYFKGYIELQKQLNRVMGEIIGTFNLGNTLILLGNYEEAKTTLDQVYNWSKEYAIVEGQFRSLHGLAENETKHLHFEKARAYYKKALQLAREEENFEFQKDLLFQLAQLVMKESNTDTINYLSEYKVISDSIAGRKTREKLLELETTYNFEKKEVEIVLLQKANLLKKTQIWVLILVSFLGILTTIFITISYRRRQTVLKQKNLLAKEKNRTQQLTIVQVEKDTLIKVAEKDKAQLKLKLKEQEIIFNTLLYAKLVNVFHEVIYKLNAFTNKFRGKHDREDFQKVLNNMETANNINPLDEFEKVFSTVHPGFYTRLIQKHPDLTPREMLFCAFIRINLQTKDIAIITNISTNSLEIARHRIRKKMNLSSDQNLTAELMMV
ncbi:MAG: tetratricopeptide repeat protein [Bacteroidetes bacterium]|nr:tetratricopeptide repeat protein [Bacteroidota bacterium]MBL6943382.1 tetratricopeptide repeat protein [Bacteroidales bacterium]